MTIRHTSNAGKTAEIFSLTDLLARFRRQVETESGEPLQDIEVNAALFLSDLCRFIGLGHRQHFTVLGPQAANFLANAEETSVHLVNKQ